MNNTLEKFKLYLLSLGLLFVFIILFTINIPICFDEACSFVGVKELVYDNVVSIISVLILVYCFYVYNRFVYDLKGATEIPFEIKRIESINYEHLTFLATYIVPLISFDFDNGRQMAVLALLLIVMGIIYIKTDLFYANPTLALLGFHIYRADGHFKNGYREGIILIYRGRIQEKQKVSYIYLDDRIYYVKEIEK